MTGISLSPIDNMHTNLEDAPVIVVLTIHQWAKNIAKDAVTVQRIGRHCGSLVYIVAPYPQVVCELKQRSNGVVVIRAISQLVQLVITDGGIPHQ
jgi:hypothetical protein